MWDLFLKRSNAGLTLCILTLVDSATLLTKRTVEKRFQSISEAKTRENTVPLDLLHQSCQPLSHPLSFPPRMALVEWIHIRVVIWFFTFIFPGPLKYGGLKAPVLWLYPLFQKEVIIYRNNLMSFLLLSCPFSIPRQIISRVVCEECFLLLSTRVWTHSDELREHKHAE